MQNIFKLTGGEPNSRIEASWATVYVPASGEVYTHSEERALELEAAGLTLVHLDTVQVVEDGNKPELTVIQEAPGPDLKLTIDGDASEASQALSDAGKALELVLPTTPAAPKRKRTVHKKTAEAGA